MQLFLTTIFTAVLTVATFFTVTFSTSLSFAASQQREPVVHLTVDNVRISTNNDLHSLARDEHYSYHFGTKWAGFNYFADFTLKLDAREPYPVKLKIVVDGMMFDAWGKCPKVLNPGQSCRTTVSFSPPFPGFYEGRLSFMMTDKNIHVDLTGIGQRRD